MRSGRRLDTRHPADEQVSTGVTIGGGVAGHVEILPESPRSMLRWTKRRRPGENVLVYVDAPRSQSSTVEPIRRAAEARRVCIVDTGREPRSRMVQCDLT